METIEFTLQTISRNVRLLRTAHNMSINDLAEKTKLSRSRINNIENNNTGSLTLNALIALSNVFGLDLSEIITPINEEEMGLIGDGFDLKESFRETQYEVKREITYYPPLYDFSYISSMLELVLILPLLSLNRLADVYCRISGDVINGREIYVSEQFEKAWEAVPDSLAKRYISKQLETLRDIRMGVYSQKNYSFDSEGFKAYRLLIEKTRKKFEDISGLMPGFPFDDDE